jgi:hypothetical protein
MILFELIVEFIESLPAPNTTTCTTDPQTISDIADCAKAHETIEKGNYKNVTPFVKYVEQVNEFNNRKTVAGQLYIPLNDTIRACVTSNNTTDKK